MQIVSVSQMQELDRAAMQDHGIPQKTLMDRAGTGLAERIQARYGNTPGLIFAGPGNNGGDGLVAARVLSSWSIPVRVVLLSGARAPKGLAAVQVSRLKGTSVQLFEVHSESMLDDALRFWPLASVTVDALLGTGARGPIRGLIAEAVTRINERPATGVVAVDVPSGLDGDTGKAVCPCVRADLTATMALPKTGLVRGEGPDAAGRIEVVPIGIPDERISAASSRLHFLELSSLPSLQHRPRRCHKGSFGHVLVIGGSTGMTGAAALASLAALRGGAGLVTLAVPESLNPTMEIKLTEVITHPLPDRGDGRISAEAVPAVLPLIRRADALVLGPGLSSSDAVFAAIRQLVQESSCPLVLDADGINAFSGRTNHLAERAGETVLTPHPGEMARLTGRDIQEIQEDREQAARQLAESTGCVTVLKGAGSVIAVPDGTCFINSTGNPGMASGGMGDVLAGIIGGFLAQGRNAVDATLLGVYLHGAAGDRAEKRLGEAGLLAGDLLEEIPPARNKMLDRVRRIR